jgi:hypothetical protein
MLPEKARADDPRCWLENAKADLALAEAVLQWAMNIIQQAMEIS